MKKRKGILIMKQWIKFFGLSFFSDSVSREAPRRGYLNLLLSAVLAFLLFFTGYLCAAVVPFSHHYASAGNFRKFVDAAFGEDAADNKRIVLIVQNGRVDSYSDYAHSDRKTVNTYANEADKKLYSVNGYNLIVDTRSATTPVVFTQVGVSKSGERISYDEYRLLSETEKEKYSLVTEYTDEEVVVDGKAAAQFEKFLKNDEEAAESYQTLQNEKSGISGEEYRSRLFELYVSRFYSNVGSVSTSSKVPVLRDYYYVNYVLEGQIENLYIFEDIVYGSFVTDSGVRLTFGGNVSGIPDGSVTDIGEFIKSVFYSSVNRSVSSYFLNAMLQLPLIAIIPFIIALLAWGAGKLWKCNGLESFGGCVKAVWAFVWFSAFVTGLAAFVIGFFAGGSIAYSLMLPIYAAVLAVRSVIYTVRIIIKSRRKNR